MAAKVVPAVPVMASTASFLLYMTMGRWSDYLFGTGTPQETQNILGQLFRLKFNRFSHQFAETVIIDGEMAGLVLAYSHRTKRSLELPTAGQILRLTGMMGFMRFVWRVLPLLGVKESERDEYYISHIAVLPEYQGQGIGTQLLAHTENKARERGFRRIALVVGVDNERAMAFYKRRGYKMVERIDVRASMRRIGLPGAYRMLKDL